MRLKTEQLKKYEAVLIPHSNLYLRHQMVQSFLLMQLRQEKDNPGVARRSLATIVVQRFNRGRYTGRRIIHWKKEWIVTRKISSIKVGKNIHTLSLINDKDRVISVESWTKRKGNSKCLILLINN